MSHSKRFRAAATGFEVQRLFPLNEAIDIVKARATAKFDESVDIAIRLGIDPKKQDQLVRGTVGLPAGTGKQVRVLVFCKGDKADEARAAGADYVGFEDLVQKIQEGWLDFDMAVATPDTMPVVGRLGKTLAPKGLMPSPKTKTVTFDVGPAVKELKAGRINYRTDKAGNIHALVGKASFGAGQLVDNVRAFMNEIVRTKPASAKGQYIRQVTLSSTMGPGVRVDLRDLVETKKGA